MSHRFLCGDAGVATAMLDKLESALFSAKHDLPFAPTLATGCEIECARRFAATNGYPLVAKPRRGHASRGVRLILDSHQLEKACAQPNIVLQKYLGDRDAVRRQGEEIARRGIPLFHALEDTKLSIQASVALDGTVVRVFATDNVMRLGRSERVHVVDDAKVIATGMHWASVFARAGWRGPLHFQCHRDASGEITTYDCKGRLTGATAARKMLGFDEVDIALRDRLGFVTAAINSALVRKVVCYLAGRALDGAKLESLKGAAYWAAPEALRITRAGDP